MNGQAWLFLALVSFQLAGTVAFIALYARGGWRDSAVGRHLMFWTIASAILDGSWLAVLTIRAAWLMWVLFAAQFALGVLTWQRVRLVWRARHAPVELTQPPHGGA